MYLATLETRNFSFLAVGESRLDAELVMEQAWADHRHETRAFDTWAEVRGDVEYLEVHPGQAFRDRQEFGYDTAQRVRDRIGIVGRMTTPDDEED